IRNERVGSARPDPPQRPGTTSRGGGEDGRADLADVLVTLLARALRLERVALAFEEPGGGRLVPLALHGPVRADALGAGAKPGGGPWSAVLPVRGPGLLLVARAGGASLAPSALALTERVAEAAGPALADPASAGSELARSEEFWSVPIGSRPSGRSPRGSRTRSATPSSPSGPSSSSSRSGRTTRSSGRRFATWCSP